jgi:hypothetical protein
MFIVVAQFYAWADSRTQGQSSAGSNQQRAEELLNNKKYSFQDLLDGNAGAVANAKEIFSLTSDPKIKLRAASVLLNIGKADQVEYDYLIGEAEKALNYANEMPWPTFYDKDGKAIDKGNPDFLKWCKAHKLNPSETFESAYFDVPMPWLFLAAARDRRSHDLLMRGLRSTNVMIVVYAAEGLARLQASDAIDDIIAACRRAPLETRASIGRALLFFPKPQAQAAAEEAITDKTALDLWRKAIESKGWKAFYDY